MSRARKITFGIGGAVALVVVAMAIYLFFIREDAPPELVLGETRTTEAPVTTTDPTVTEPDPTVTETVPVETVPAGVEGAWAADPLSVAGYRVVENFRGVPDFEAVGRTTTPITGSMTITGTVISDASFTVDVAGIESPESLRDGQFRQVMSTDEFPTATFELRSPIELGEVPANAEPITVTVVGDLTLRGVTLPVTFDMTAQLNNQKIETLAQIPIVFSEFGIDTPSAPGITVNDNGLLEASIIFQRPQ